MRLTRRSPDDDRAAGSSSGGTYSVPCRDKNTDFTGIPRRSRECYNRWIKPRTTLRRNLSSTPVRTLCASRIAISLVCAAGVIEIGAMEPAPGPPPPNGSRVTATVVARHATPPADKTEVRDEPPQPAMSLELDVTRSEPLPGLEHLARAGQKITAFSGTAMSADVVGRRVEATLRLTGDTRNGFRWIIDTLTLLP